MSQAILISNNQVINDLYELNLRAYVATNVTIKKNLSDASDLIKHNPNIDAIICFSELNKNEGDIKALFDFLSALNSNVPVIIMGETNRTFPNSIILQNKYDIKSLLQAMAKILEITAKDMADKEVPKYFPIPIKLVAELKSSDCDIFYRNKKGDFDFEYFKIIEKNSSLQEVLKKYIDEGLLHLYINANERLKFINKASAIVVKELSRSDLTHAEKIEITSQGLGFVAEDIFENQMISQSVADISTACVNSIKEVISVTPSVRSLLKMLLENKNDYVYKHSVIATYIATQIIKNMPWGSEEQQEKVTFALFFHDIFLVPVYKKYPHIFGEEDLLFDESVAQEDKDTVLQHAKLAGQIIQTFPRCPVGADLIITQHHGMTSGEGFAVQFKDNISPLAKIIIIAEDVTSNILSKFHQQSDEKVNTEKVNKKTDKNLLIKKLISKYRYLSYRKIIETLEVVELD